MQAVIDLSRIITWVRERLAATRARLYDIKVLGRLDAFWHSDAMTTLCAALLIIPLLWLLDEGLAQRPATDLGPEWVRAVTILERLDLSVRMDFLEKTLLLVIPTTLGFGILAGALNALTPYASPGLLLRLRGWDQKLLGTPILGYFAGRRSPLLIVVLPGAAAAAGALTLAALAQWHHLNNAAAPVRPFLGAVGIVAALGLIQFASVLYLLFWLAKMRSPKAAGAHMWAHATELLRHVERADHFTRNREPASPGVEHVYEEQVQLELLLDALGQLALLTRREGNLKIMETALAQAVDVYLQTEALDERARLRDEWRRQAQARVDAPAVLEARPLLNPAARFPERGIAAVDRRNWWLDRAVGVVERLLRESVVDRDGRSIEHALGALAAIAQPRQPRATADAWSAVERSCRAIIYTLRECASEQIVNAELLLEKLTRLWGPPLSSIDARAWSDQQGLGIATLASDLHEELLHTNPRRRTAARSAFTSAAWNADARSSVASAVMVALAAAQTRRLRRVVAELQLYLSQIDGDGRGVLRGLSPKLQSGVSTIPLPSDVDLNAVRRAVAVAASFGPRWRPRARALARACRDGVGAAQCAAVITANSDSAGATAWRERLAAL